MDCNIIVLSATCRSRIKDYNRVKHRRTFGKTVENIQLFQQRSALAMGIWTEVSPVINAARQWLLCSTVLYCAPKSNCAPKTDGVLLFLVFLWHVQICMSLGHIYLSQWLISNCQFDRHQCTLMPSDETRFRTWALTTNQMVTLIFI